MRTEDVARLVACAAAGEEWAWTALVVRFRPTLTAVARRHRLGAADADEVEQRTWLRLMRSIGAIHQPAQLRAWLITTARRESLRLLAERREDPVAEPPEPRQDDADDTPEATADECRLALERALQHVTPRQRALLRLLMQNPTPSYEDISKALGIPVGSIGPTRARCLERLRGDERLARAVGAQPRPRRRARGARRRP
jgi:RNA polymerase sigma factor (sigma-70 family)